MSPVVRVLGAFGAEVAGVAADLGGPRQRSVLARLVAARGAMVPADRLVDDLWAGTAPPRAAAGLQSFVSHLRRALEPDRPPRTPARVLVTEPPGYALRLPDGAVDAWRFDALIDEAAALRPGDPGEARRRAEAALAEWRGPAYAEFAALPWAAAEAARLDERRRLAVEHRAEAMLGLGAAAEAVPDLEAHAAANPLREEAWRLLALALYRSGRQGDALAALRRARTALAEELGVDPGPALRDLEAGILAHAPDLAGAAPPPVREAVVRPEPPGAAFVGRARELARLDEAAREAEAGRGATVLISGDAGMGKTALAERFARLLTARGWTCAWGRAPETGGAPAAWPWAELLRDLAATAPPAAGLAGRLAPLLDDAATGDGGADVSAGRFRLHLAAGDYLADLAAGTPLLLVLEDLHWADEETLALLTRLAGRLRDRRVLLAATFRHTEIPDPLAAALAVLARLEPARIELPGLSAAEVAELVRAACGVRLGDAELSAIAERTGGNPFFTRETARLVAAEGLPAAARRVPAGVGDVLRRRIARLPAPAQAVLRDAAVAGRDAGLDVLADLSGDEDAVLDAVESALAAGLVTEPAPGRMRFAHALVRDTLYTGLSSARRARLHGRVAASLERRRPDEVAAIAHHYLESGTAPGPAVRYARLAAEAAEARYAHRLAADLWAGAAETLRSRGGGATGERLELEAAAIRATALAGHVVDARDRRRRAIADARAFGDVRLLARIIVAFDVPTLWTSREYGILDCDVIEAAEYALAGPPGDDPALRARLLTTLAIELEGEQDDRGPAAAREAMETARGLGDPALLAAALNGGYLNGYRSAEGLHERLRIAAELLELATEHDLPRYRVLAHLQFQQAEVASLDLAAARRHLDEGRRLAEQYGLPLLAMIAEWYAGLAHTFGARFDEAERVYTQVGGAIGRTGIWSSERGMMLVGAFCLRYVQGRAGELVGETAWLHEQWPHVAATADLHALALAAAGRADEARRVVQGDPGPIRRDYFYDLVMAIRGRRAIALGEPDLAARAYEALLPYEGHVTGGATAVATIGPVALILGDLARFLGLPAETAAAHDRKAAEVAHRLNAPFWIPAAARP
ncbi:BTAD domain-containing putative transcriptional regulator [Actinomadura verrucosospora]|uniref:Winged helix family transcriptional regulator ATPase n=1 Tax=Actinomadura verrucosospora TaxID=46165 RepID=A0A7D3ZS43_ACTVE|nr:BTAD domain-containing putative transcriptional regulator [Actinomadura verrucosospora]QKG26263.1 winged helix family transcriptional regulator ATPase [Actinomadura verrucosospora]